MSTLPYQTNNVTLIPEEVKASQRPMNFWVGLALFIFYGYSFLGKWFAFFAIPLSALLLLNSAIVLNPWFKALTRRGPLGGVSWALLLALMCGVCQLVRGLLLGYEVYAVFQILLFNVTPVYLFVGVWLRRPTRYTAPKGSRTRMGRSRLPALILPGSEQNSSCSRNAGTILHPWFRFVDAHRPVRI